jgi:sulfite exporter TauE/SafE
MQPLARPFDLILLLTTGLTISLGHCTGMCGPLVFGYAASQREPGVGTWRLTGRLVTYHSGRVLSYSLLGAVMGLLGSTVFFAGSGRVVQGVLSVLVGVLMLLLGSGLFGLLPTNRWIESGPWARFAQSGLKGLLAARTPLRRLLLGIANGFLPCGPVFSVAMTSAATGSIWKGASAMAVFGIGTVPLLVALGLGVGQLSARWRAVFNRVGGVLILLIAAQLILRGLAVWEVIPHLRYGEFVVY